MSLASLFESNWPPNPVSLFALPEAVQKSLNGLKYTTLSNAGRFFNLQPIKVTVPLARRGHEHYHHEGEEWIYVLAGSLTLSLMPARLTIWSRETRRILIRACRTA